MVKHIEIKKVDDIRDIRYLQQLLDLAIPVNDKELSDADQMYYHAIKSKQNRSWAINCGKIAFIYNGNLYVIPYTEDIKDILVLSKFRQRNFKVPFAEKGYPSSHLLRWTEYIEQSYSMTYIGQMNDARKMYAAMGITLDLDIIKNCLKIPAGGIQVETKDYGFDIVYPLFYYHDINFEDKIGRYNSKEGRVIFVYSDGETYIAKSDGKLEEILEEAGYKVQENFQVPLLRCDVLLNEEQALIWEKLPIII